MLEGHGLNGRLAQGISSLLFHYLFFSRGPWAAVYVREEAEAFAWFNVCGQPDGVGSVPKADAGKHSRLFNYSLTQGHGSNLWLFEMACSMTRSNSSKFNGLVNMATAPASRALALM